MVADVAEGKSSQDSIAEGMDGYVSVRVRHKSYRAFYAYSSEPHRQSFGDGVYIITVTNPEWADVLIHGISILILRQKYGKNTYLC